MSSTSPIPPGARCGGCCHFLFGDRMAQTGFCSLFMKTTEPNAGSACTAWQSRIGSCDQSFGPAEPPQCGNRDTTAGTEDAQTAGPVKWSYEIFRNELFVGSGSGLRGIDDVLAAVRHAMVTSEKFGNQLTRVVVTRHASRNNAMSARAATEAPQ